jgi:release factor glutamine methyltransferase
VTAATLHGPPGTLGQAVREGERRLEAAGVPDAVTDARLLLSHALSASPTWIFVHAGDSLPAEGWTAYEALLARRAARIPLQHLTGTQDFWSLRLSASRAALVPRPETETLVEAVVNAVGDRERLRFADVGTGSGCVALALLTELPLSRAVGVDVSPDALALAAANARALCLDDRLELVLGSLLEPLADRAPLDAVVANLPYVSEAEWAGLEPEVRDHDPRLALVAGPRGTELIEALVAQAPARLAVSGLLALEVGAGQAEAVAGLLRTAGFVDVGTRRDLGLVERVVCGRWPGTARLPPAPRG